MEDSEFDNHDEFGNHKGLVLLNLEEALRKAKEQAVTRQEQPELDYALELALIAAVAPLVKETRHGININNVTNKSLQMKIYLTSAKFDMNWS